MNTYIKACTYILAVSISAHTHTQWMVHISSLIEWLAAVFMHTY
jgi:hypothetical protein